MKTPLSHQELVDQELADTIEHAHQISGHKPSLAPNTDCGWLYQFLSDCEEHSLNEILERSFAERGCGLTVHSRVSNLRTHGLQIEHRFVPGRKRGHASVYRMVDPLRSAAAPFASPKVRAAVEQSGSQSGRETEVASASDEACSDPLSTVSPEPQAVIGTLSVPVADRVSQPKRHLEAASGLAAFSEPEPQADVGMGDTPVSLAARPSEAASGSELQLFDTRKEPAWS